MRFTLEQEFDFPLDKLLRAREDRVKHLDEFPDFEHVHIEEDVTEGKIRRVRRAISMSAKLPAAVQSVMPSLSNMEEVSTFDLDEHVHEFVMNPRGRDDVFQMKGVSKYGELPEGRSYRSYEIEVTSRMFLVGPLVERAIANIHQNNLVKDKASLEKFIRLYGDEYDRE